MENFGQERISGGKTMRQAASRLFALCILLALSSALVGCHGMFGPIGPKEKVMLFNGTDFTGWKLYVADKTIDVHDVWSVSNGVVHCEGRPNGYMRTRAKYKDYHLHLEWRWPGEPTNSGVLLHAKGPDKVWPRCIECQLKAGNAGDLVLIGGTGITVDGQDRQNVEKQFVVIPKKQQSSESPPGRWNTYEIYCKGDAVRCYVNGVLQNEGTNATETAGWVCLQSEGGPIEFRNIHVEPLDY